MQVKQRYHLTNLPFKKSGDADEIHGIKQGAVPKTSIFSTALCAQLFTGDEISTGTIGCVIERALSLCFTGLFFGGFLFATPLRLDINTSFLTLERRNRSGSFGQRIVAAT